MSKLSEIVRVERRFALSARLDTDLNGTPPLTGYVLQSSVRKSLEAMLDGIAEGSQYAFTWTGPYGGGKSCAALLVANLVGGNKKQRALAEEIVGEELAGEFSAAFVGRGKSWGILALTGRRTSLSNALADAAAETFDWSEEIKGAAVADDRILIDELESRARSKGGLLIVIDELGKFLEHAMGDGGDVHILQDLAERAARSEGRLVVVGILHQSFEQYAGRLNRSARDEWAKVQGRFQNVPFVAQADEVAALLARAIHADETPAEARGLASKTALAISKRRPVDIALLTNVLADAWPLHPVSALLLGPMSRQRFAQNERSVFGFLSSAEPHGFQAHLAQTDVGDASLYGPDQLWDYLVANFGTALSVGPDGNRMTLAIEAVERATLQGSVAARLTKSAAIIELFRNGSGLAVADDILALCAPAVSIGQITKTLDDLVNRAILIRQPRLGGYALFAGSDFDLDDAMAKIGLKLDAEVLADLPSRLGVGPIAAKSHYFETGALRVFDVLLQFAGEVPVNPAAWAKKTAAALAKRKRSSSGILVLLMPDARSFDAKLELAARILSRELKDAGVLGAVAATNRVYLLRDHATDLCAIDQIEASHPRLEGDRIARRELTARRAQITDAVRSELMEAFFSSRWWAFDKREQALDGKGLTVVASALCASAYHSAPVIQSELLYRDKPSSSAMAGLRAILHAMVAKSNIEDLGIENYPVERGHYLTVLAPLGLHRKDDNGEWRFTDPDEEGAGKSLQPAWRLLKEERVNLGELFDLWAARPFGIKRGVMPMLALAYLLANRTLVAVYVDGLYQALIDDVVADRLLQDASAVEFRRISRSKRDEQFIHQLAALLSTNDKVVEANALPVASALFQRFHALPLWSQRTAHLEEKVRKVRDVVLKASDPEVLLFSDLKSVLQGETDPAVAVTASLLKAETVYPAMLHEIKCRLAEHLSVDPATFEGIGFRASTAAGISGELRLEAFIMRAGGFEGGDGDIEGLASLLVHKPPRNWSDREQEQAMFEMAKLAHRFRDAEAYARIKGRAPTAKAISVMIGLDPTEKPLFHAFHVSEEEFAHADDIATELFEQLKKKELRSAVSLTALARIVERLSAGQELEQI
ncbi:ATP-binding protein [Mesorhizobium sp. M4B.F.Ca.ET.017.02.2.1]|uniref:ATP-binding protein n=2 Tax=unclassified Mesorhizobium TaxID=325217 RepID=UPI000FCAAF86|nr:ATP-binding protein [Mesorhizobium sp. M4B.F.Ca.ET.017.02.2.1]RVD31755.1 ATP-binding protein [Mesorhizobium sp. M4B.F.Ca.ET.017.02.2.1]